MDDYDEDTEYVNLALMSQSGTPQINYVAEWKNKIRIETARTMLGESKLPTYFQAEAVNTPCYINIFL